VCWEDNGEIKCEREEDRRARELEERLKQHMEAKLFELLKALVEQYEIDVSLDPTSGKGVGRWKRKQ
jgi:hypothetical protein